MTTVVCACATPKLIHTPDRHAIPTNLRAGAPPSTGRLRQADRHPHCAWIVIIDESYPEADGALALDVRSVKPKLLIELDNDVRGSTTQTHQSAGVRPGLRGVRHSALCGWPMRFACKCTCWTRRSPLQPCGNGPKPIPTGTAGEHPPVDRSGRAGRR